MLTIFFDEGGLREDHLEREEGCECGAEDYPAGSVAGPHRVIGWDGADIKFARGSALVVSGISIEGI